MLSTPLMWFFEVIVIQYLFSVLQSRQITYTSSSFKKPSLVKVLSLSLYLSLSLLGSILIALPVNSDQVSSQDLKLQWSNQ